MDTLKGQIHGLIVDATCQLDVIEDYYEHTNAALRIIQNAVTRDGMRFEITTSTSVDVIDQSQFVSELQLHITERLLPDVLRRVVSTCEDFLFDCYKSWLLRFPEAMQQKKIDFSEVLAATSLDELRDRMASRIVDEIKYERPSVWFDKLSKNTGVPSPSEMDIKMFAEIKATRDIHIHSNGIANETYLNKAGDQHRVKVGEYLEVGEPYYRQSCELARRIVTEFGTSLEEHAPD